METKSFLGLDGLNHFWEKAKIWIVNEISTKIAGIVLSSVPTGTVLSGLYTTVPNGFLLCNEQEVSIASFHKLYTEIGSLACCQSSNSGMFKLPDLRECVLVGTGQSTRAILDKGGHSHDVYDLGEFKDDQLQEHTHDIKNSHGSVEISYHQYDKTAGGNDAIPTNLLKTVSMSGRTGTTTHGKQIGVNYIIKY